MIGIFVFLFISLNGPMVVEVLGGLVASINFAALGILLALTLVQCTHKKPKRSTFFKHRTPTCETISIRPLQTVKSSTTQQSSNTREDEPVKLTKKTAKKADITPPEVVKIPESSRIMAESSRPAGSSAEMAKALLTVSQRGKKKVKGGGQKSMMTTTSVQSTAGVNTTTKQSEMGGLPTSAEKTNNQKIPDVSPSVKEIIDWEHKMRQEFPEVTEPTQRGSTASIKQNAVGFSSGEGGDVVTPPLSLHEDENGNKFLSSHSSNDADHPVVKNSQKDSVYMIQHHQNGQK